MGTRADFYIGKGKDAEWIGSVSHDGYPEGVLSVLDVYTKDRFIEEINKLETFIDPLKGWPWPWLTSATSDYSYYWTEEGLIILHFWHGEKYFNSETREEDLSKIPECYGRGGCNNKINIVPPMLLHVSV